MYFAGAFEALEEARVRYLVVGGVAVVLHGFVRATGDLDIFVDLERENVERFLSVVKAQGYLPKPPVPLEDFADPEKRRSWVEEKGMLVFSLFHQERQHELVDVFVVERIPFEEAYARRKIVNADGITVSLVSLRDLITLKRLAGRPQDREDLKALESKLERENG
ncbi:MAG: hypothetical protein CO113_13630 [Elusimicrobia bacterium CG_4_9_14_3_um_filter_62_55]|nr:MAG: hypothetical protein COR54_00175 [Elusimicrobia bacterium CG22_combo_CG10-13_8_21_14_all_63_91]PJA18133.1 MAG: hypothetical protein COX66_02150 [Elusimicrobia bacterium CG_4_10_14_0_2_um_filter_63_34]PJB24474.1 MAG: hypothetical protein CO113_13630 [Elusimicrobia bacterium CG_4_9_14_3_um_filter_62_55]